MLRFHEAQLIVDQIPNSFILRLIPSGYFLLREFAPGTFTDDATDLFQYLTVSTTAINSTTPRLNYDLHYP